MFISNRIYLSKTKKKKKKKKKKTIMIFNVHPKIADAVPS